MVSLPSIIWVFLLNNFSRVINLLLTKLARDRTGRISTLGLFCTDLAALGPYHRGQKILFFTSCGFLIPFTRANAQWDIHGFISTLVYTSELILCFIICVHSAKRHNIHMYPNLFEFGMAVA